MARSFLAGGNTGLDSVNTSIPWGIGTGPYTVVMWVFPTSFPSTFSGVTSFTDDTDNSVQPAIFTSSNATPNAWRASAGGATRIFNSSLSPNTWTHLALRRTSTGAGGLQGFFNGSQEASTFQDALSFLEKTWVIGSGRTNGALGMSGRIAEVAVYNVALSDAEITALAKGVSPSLVRPGKLRGHASLYKDTDLDRIQGLSFIVKNNPGIADHPRIFVEERLGGWSRRSLAPVSFQDTVLGLELSTLTQTGSIEFPNPTLDLDLDLFPPETSLSFQDTVLGLDLDLFPPETSLSFTDTVLSLDLGLFPAETSLLFQDEVLGLDLVLLPTGLGFSDTALDLDLSLFPPETSLLFQDEVLGLDLTLLPPGLGFSDTALDLDLGLFPAGASLFFQDEILGLALDLLELPSGFPPSFQDSELDLELSLFEPSISTPALAFLSQFQRIQHRLLQEAQDGPYYAFRIDPNTKRVTVRLAAGSEIYPISVFADEVSSETGEARSNRTEYRRERLTWMWEVTVAFAEQATIEMLERRLAAKPPFLPPDSENDLEWVRLLWIDSRYEHPPQQQSSNGTRATMTFEAVLGPS